MKKRLLIIFTAMILGVTGCSSEMIQLIKEELFSREKFELELSEIEMQRQQNMDAEGVYPFFDSLSEEEQEIYQRICTGIEEHDSSEILLSSYDSEEECKAAAERLGVIYRHLIYEQPEYFWVNVSEHHNVMWTKGAEYQLGIQLSFVMEYEERQAKQETFLNVADTITQGAQAQEGTYAKVLYVYDAILEKASYDHVLAEGLVGNALARSAYGCLVDGKTVCSGYALAFNLIMQRLGYPCGVEVDANGESDTEIGHIWNYANLDGAYYYFDLTWDDTIFDKADYKQYVSHGYEYFAITKSELPHTLSEKAVTPECNGTQYNYFIYNNWNVAAYDYGVVKEMIQRQAGQKCIAIRFDNDSDLLQAQEDLFTKEKIFDILKNVDDLKYLLADSNRHLYIFLD